MKKDCILDFVKSWDQYDKDNVVLYAKANWNRRFRESGYYSIEAGRIDNWIEVHFWCTKQFGSEHYFWSENTFWFEKEQDAMMFALRWS